MSASIAKIVSDGTPNGTKVYLADGRELEGVVRAEWSIEVGRPAELRIELEGAFLLEGAALGLSVEALR